MNLYKEWQSRDKIRAFKARYDKTYAVSSNHFTRFCKVPSLDFNIEEELQTASVHLVKIQLEI